MFWKKRIPIGEYFNMTNALLTGHIEQQDAILALSAVRDLFKSRRFLSDKRAISFTDSLLAIAYSNSDPEIREKAYECLALLVPGGNKEYLMNFIEGVVTVASVTDNASRSSNAKELVQKILMKFPEREATCMRSYLVYRAASNNGTNETTFAKKMMVEQPELPLQVLRKGLTQLGLV